MKPKFTRIIDGIPCMTMTEHEAIVASRKREWAGLTDEEIKVLYDKYATYQKYDAWESGWFDFARAIEATLKAKNEAT